MAAARLGNPLLQSRSSSGGSASSSFRQSKSAEDLAFRIALERLFSRPSDTSASRSLRVAYQGGRGSYSHEAAAVSFCALPRTVTTFPCEHMEDAFSALETGIADRAIVPSENSLDGPVPRNFDLLLRHPLVEIAAELVLPVNHCLLSLPRDTVLRRVASHPQALAHCRNRLSALALPTEEMPSAAAAAAALARGQLTPGTAVIASRAAAREFRLAVVEENLQEGGNLTRFLQLTLRRGDTAEAGAKKATVAFALEKGPSELHRAIWAFECRGMVVTRVDHRPDRALPGRSGRFEYVFLLDVEAASGMARFDSTLNAALTVLGEICRFVRVMGVYGSTTAS